MTAPPAPRLIPKSSLGVTVWTEVLLDKYLYGRPTVRLYQALQHHGVPLSQGTVTDLLQIPTTLFIPTTNCYKLSEALLLLWRVTGEPVACIRRVQGHGRKTGVRFRGQDSHPGRRRGPYSCGATCLQLVVIGQGIGKEKP